jgi:hypothetical protein
MILIGFIQYLLKIEGFKKHFLLNFKVFFKIHCKWKKVLLAHIGNCNVTKILVDALFN